MTSAWGWSSLNRIKLIEFLNDLNRKRWLWKSTFQTWNVGLVLQHWRRRERRKSRAAAININVRELIVWVQELPVCAQLLQSSKLNGIDRLFFDARFIGGGIVDVAWKGKREKLERYWTSSKFGSKKGKRRLRRARKVHENSYAENENLFTNFTHVKSHCTHFKKISPSEAIDLLRQTPNTWNWD